MCKEIYPCGCIPIHTRVCVQYTNIFIHTHTGKDRNCGAMNHIRHLRAKKYTLKNQLNTCQALCASQSFNRLRERENMFANVFRHTNTYSQLVLVWWVLQALDMRHNATCSHHPHWTSVEHCRNHEPLQKLHHLQHEFVCECTKATQKTITLSPMVSEQSAQGR